MDAGNSVVAQENCPNSNRQQTEKTIKSDNEKTTSVFLYFTATIANLNYMMLGISVIWISPVTAKLLSYNSEENPLGRPVTTVELSLIGSLSPTGMVLGPLIMGKVYDQFGRKRCINVLSSLNVICYLVLAFAKHIYLYYVMIFLIGISLGGITVGLCMYISEITEDHNRGKLSCYMGCFMPVGNLYGFILGPFLSIKIFTILCTLPSVVAIIISELVLPESPQFLINKGRNQDALNCLKKLLGGNNCRAERVTNNIVSSTNKNDAVNKSSIKELFMRKNAKNALIICCVLSSMPACTGLAPIMSYLEPIFESSGIELSGSICAIAIGVLQIFCYFTASVLIEKWGRRPLLFYSAITITIPLSFLGVYFYLISLNSEIVNNLKWVPFAGIVLLVITGVTGISSVAVAVTNEVFTSDIKSTAMSFVYSLSGILIAGSIFLLPVMTELVGIAWSFWTFAALCILASTFIYLRVPETKGKDILEIQDLLTNKI